MTYSPKSLTRRRLLGQAGAAAGVAALPTAARSRGAVAAPWVRRQENCTTTFMNWDAIEDTPLEAVIQEFERQTGNTVEVIPTPGSGGDYETKVRTMLAGGTVPDIMRTNDDYVRYYSVKDQILDLTPYIERDGVDQGDYFDSIWNFSTQPTGNYTGWSLGSQPRLIYYNIDMFEEAGVALPPRDWVAEGWTWDDFLETARQLTIEGERWGALVYDDTGYEQTFSVNNGEESGIYAEDGETFTLSSDKGIEAIQWVTDLTCEHGVQPEWGLVTPDDAGENLFVQGKVGMIFRTQGTLDYFRRNITDFAWDVAPVPARENQLTEGSLIVFTIPKAAENPECAWELLNFMAGPEGSKIFASMGAFIPAYRESAELIAAGEDDATRYPENIGLFSRGHAAPDHG